MTKSAPSKNARLTSFLRRALRLDYPRRFGSFGGITRLCAFALATGVITAGGDAFAQGRFRWNNATNPWETAGNWTPLDAGVSPPETPGERALFGPSGAPVNPVISSFIEIDDITFEAGAAPYTITINTGGDLFLVGDGVRNDSDALQIIQNNGTSSIVLFDNSAEAQGVTINNAGTDSVVRFFLSSSAGTAIIINNDSNSGLIDFLDNSSAGFSQINNSADFTVGAGGVQFSNSSTAANSTIINIVANSNTAFSDATAGNAQITNQGDGSNTIFRGGSDAGSSTIDNGSLIPPQGVGSFTQFEDTSSAAGATIRNLGDFSSIIFLESSRGGSSDLINSALAATSTFILFADQSNAEDATIRNENLGGIVTFDNDANAGNSTILNGASLLSGGGVDFLNNSGAGTSQIFNLGNDARLTFNNFSRAENATITNSGFASNTVFSDSSTAGNATITNSGSGSYTLFQDSASGGSAALINANPTAFIDIAPLATAGTTAGSIAGNGAIYLGSKNLTVGLNDASTTFSGVIQDGDSGVIVVGGVGGSLTKVGLGTLTLTGANTYTGDTTVDGGALIINGSIVSPNTFVNAAGLLGGMGVIGGNVFNHGTVEPGYTPSGLTVHGSYTQASDGDLRIKIASNSKFGKLKVGGAANLDGSVTAVGVDGFKPKRGDRFTFLTADGGVNGEFDELNSEFETNTILRFGLDYDSNAVSLEVEQGSFRDFADEFGLTPNQKAVASALDKVAFDDRERRLIDFLNQRTLDQLPEDFDRIAPDELAAIFDISFGLANVQAMNLQRRTDDIRNGSTGFSAAHLAMQGTGPSYSGSMGSPTGAAGPTGNETKEMKSVDVPEENRWGVFLSGIGEWIDVDGDGNARGYEIATGGFTVGIDYKVNPNFAVGLSAGYAGTGADLTGDGRVFVNGGKLGLYATYFTGGFYVDAAVNGGYNSYDTKRDALEGTARGDTEGLEFNALLGAGYDFTAGNLRIGPTASVQYTNVEIDEFSERGSLAPLQMEEQNAESLRTAVGFRTTYNIELRNGVVIRPELRAGWQHEFGDRRFALDSRFASGAGSVFTVYGPEYGRDSLLLSAGVTVVLNDRTALFLNYDGQLARRNYDSHSVSGGIRIAY